jgi:hypothetical protein
MAFAYQSKFRQFDILHQLPAQDAMANIGMPAIAAKFRAVCFQDSDIVQHGGICDKFKIRLQMGDLFGSHEGLTCHMFTMGHQDIKCLRIPAVIFCKDIFRIHISIWDIKAKRMAHRA